MVADIKSMFHQVRVDPSDRSALRFLYWRDGDPDEVVNAYEMSVHAFGLTSSLSVAGYALRRTVVDNQSKFSVETCNTANMNFYVDDLLKSVATSEGLVALIDEQNKLWTCGGFKLMKFSSNYPELLNGVSSERLLPRYVRQPWHRYCKTSDNRVRRLIGPNGAYPDVTRLSGIYCTRKGHRLFLFPRKENRRQKWIDNCQRNGWTPTKHSKLCEVYHLKISCFNCPVLLSLIFGSGYFAVNCILPLEAILPRDICDWSILIIF